MCRITVFTPTYNQAYIIEKLYRSLQRQTFRDFEWLIVDDGSSNNTEEVISAWQKEGNDFPISYQILYTKYAVQDIEEVAQRVIPLHQSKLVLPVQH